MTARVSLRALNALVLHIRLLLGRHRAALAFPALPMQILGRMRHLVFVMLDILYLGLPVVHVTQVRTNRPLEIRNVLIAIPTSGPEKLPLLA